MSAQQAASRRHLADVQRMSTLEGLTSFAPQSPEVIVYSRSRDFIYCGVLAKKMQTLYHGWKENLKSRRSAFRPKD